MIRKRKNLNLLLHKVDLFHDGCLEEGRGEEWVIQTNYKNDLPITLPIKLKVFVSDSMFVLPRTSVISQSRDL